MHGGHPRRFAWRSMVWENGRRLRPLLAILTEWISEAVVGFLELPFALLCTGCRLEFAIGFEQHSLALGLEMVPCPFQNFEPVEGRPELPLERCKLLERFGQSLKSL
jgi:hypothetical protein